MNKGNQRLCCGLSMRAKDRELETMKLEAMERDQRRKFELEMMRLSSNTGASVPYFTQVPVQHRPYTASPSPSTVSSNEFSGDYSIEGQLNGTSSGEENTYFRL